MILDIMIQSWSSIILKHSLGDTTTEWRNNCFSIVDNFIMDIKRCRDIFPLNEIRAVSKYFTALELIACDKHWAVLYQSFQLLLLRRVGDMLRVR